MCLCSAGPFSSQKQTHSVSHDNVRTLLLAIVCLCIDHQFMCSNGHCISEIWKCDGDMDCMDNSDEDPKLCSQTCPPKQFSCSTGQCIPNSWICDLEDDCGDRSDEHDCGECSTYQQPVQYMTHEAVRSFAYHEDHSFIMKELLDTFFVQWQYNDCGDNSDEVGCSKSCVSTQFKCDSGRCIPKAWTCDKDNDCGDYSDEDNANCSSQSLCDSICLPAEKLCDGVDDCPDGSDEVLCGEILHTTVPQTSWVKIRVRVSHNCTAAADEGIICTCPLGMELGSDNKTCHVQSLCAKHLRCSQRCEQHKFSVKCSCYEGWALEADMETCRSTGEHWGPFIIFSNRHEIRRIDLYGGKYNLLVPKLSNTIALDFHFNQSTLYWTDVLEDKIYRSITDIEVVIQYGLATTEGLAVDWIADNIYWVESKLNQIEVAKLDGSMRTTLMAEGVDHPRAIYDGSGLIEVLRGHEYISHPFAITLYGSDIYWTDWHTNTLAKANKWTGRNVAVVQRSSTQSFDLHVYHPSRQPLAPNPCAAHGGRGSCSHLCLISYNQSFSCACPHLMKLHSDKRTCYGKLGGATPMVNLPSVHGLAVDWVSRNLFWTSNGNNWKQINVARLDGSFKKAIIEGLDKPQQLTLYPQLGYLFWTEWGHHPRIERSRLDGSQRDVLVHIGISWPNGLTIDYQEGLLYWCDAGTDKIERINLETGENREVVLEPIHPFALAVYGGHIFWTDWARKAVLRADKYAGADVKVLRSDILHQPMGSIVPTGKSSPCQLNNGGCQELCLLTPEGRVNCSCRGNRKLLKDNTCTGESTGGRYLYLFCSLFGISLGYFACPSGRCIPSSWTCDGENDCENGADEHHCGEMLSSTCDGNSFMCQNRQCIPSQFVCDHDIDCSDGSDESPECEYPTCGPEEFHCANGQCLPTKKLECDGKYDCHDYSDEAPENPHLKTCNSSAYMCKNGNCVNETQLCDHNDDCGDGSDELNSERNCTSNQFQCAISMVCIPRSWVCDHDMDCADGSDEHVNCSKGPYLTPPLCSSTPFFSISPSPLICSQLR
uniref:EGF-like domain-containing protein n=1 Tax=Paramormyrops kingsleyae TaxID=1676925 RepID=A0A3B3RJA6_9TELE